MILSAGRRKAIWSLSERSMRQSGKSLRCLSSSAQSGKTSEPKPNKINISVTQALGISGLTLCAGYATGKLSTSSNDCEHHHDHDDDASQQSKRVLPSGVPRACCSCDAPESKAPSKIDLTPEQASLPAKISKIVGPSNLLSGLEEDSNNTIYLKGARLGRGKALAIVTPTSLQDAVKALEVVVNSDCVVVPQGANTGLTGGSVPRDDGDNRPSVIISMRKMDTMFPIDDGKRVVCLAGAGIASLSQAIPSWGFTDRESHSILGSTFLNPTTAAGIAFGSGGTQLRKGPAYTDRAMYAKVSRNKWGKNVIEIVNTLGIDGIEDKDFVNGSGTAIEQLDIYSKDVASGYQRPMAKSSESANGKAMASDRNYSESVCTCGANDKRGNEVSRYNADTKGIDCNRSEGKVLILATVHDTFQKASESKSFWVSFTDLDTALAFRKEVCLDNAKDLPISVEYMDRDSFDIIDRSGRVLANMIKVVGMGSLIGFMWNIKLKIEALPFEGSDLFCDKLLHNVNNLTPEILPSHMMKVGREMDHHVAMTIGDFGDGELERCLDRLETFKHKYGNSIKVIECNDQKDAASLTAFRFVAAPAFRTWCIGENVQGISVDYALPKNGGGIPPLDEGQPIPLKRMRYSHFGCNVVHEDLAYALGVDTEKAKYGLKKQVEHVSKGKLPAEHGHGTEYHAPVEAQNRWKKMDPLNIMNPGIGGLSSKSKYQ